MKKYLDNLHYIAKIKGVSHESLAHAIQKERSVLTKKLSGQIPLTADEFFTLVSHLEIDWISLVTAKTEADLREIAEMGYIKPQNPAEEIPMMVKRFGERYQDCIDEDKRDIFVFLVRQLIELFEKK